MTPVQMSVDLRYQLSQAVMRREETQRELRDLATRTSRQTEHSSQVAQPSPALNVSTLDNHDSRGGMRGLMIEL